MDSASHPRCDWQSARLLRFHSTLYLSFPLLPLPPETSTPAPSPTPTPTPTPESYYPWSLPRMQTTGTMSSPPRPRPPTRKRLRRSPENDNGHDHDHDHAEDADADADYPSVPHPHLPIQAVVAQIMAAPRADGEDLNPETVLFFLARRCGLHYHHFEKLLSGLGADASFSKVQYASIAPLFGLDKRKPLPEAAKRFPARRARVPRAVVLSVLKTLQKNSQRVGTLVANKTEQARSELITPFVNEIVDIFDSQIRDEQEGLLRGFTTHDGRIEHVYSALRAIALLFLEIKLRTLEGDDAVSRRVYAQLLAKCDTLACKNFQDGFRVPVYGLLTDGSRWEFVKFERYDYPLHGKECPTSWEVFASSWPALRDYNQGQVKNKPSPITIAEMGFDRFPNQRPPTHLSFVEPHVGGEDACVRSVRKITEVIYWIFLTTYANAIEANAKAATENQDETRADAWNACLRGAREALELAQEGAARAESSRTDEADELATRSIQCVKDSVRQIPEEDQNPRGYCISEDVVKMA